MGAPQQETFTRAVIVKQDAPPYAYGGALALADPSLVPSVIASVRREHEPVGKRFQVR